MLTALDDQGQTTIFSTMKNLNAKNGHLSGGVPTIKINREDNPNENKMKRLTLDISFSGVKPSSIRNL